MFIGFVWFEFQVAGFYTGTDVIVTLANWVGFV